jgi:hypothetical protein
MFTKILTCSTRANALVNAVKKQYGLHTYLLHLKLPSPAPPPVPVPALFPRLPSASAAEGEEANQQAAQRGLPVSHGAIRMCDTDIQETARFVREFVTMSLIPWMEKCVLDWNETVCYRNF